MHNRTGVSDIAPATVSGAVPLGTAPLGFRGVVAGIRPLAGDALPPEEIERRLIELGFTEGADVEILHEGLIRHDPIAVRVNYATIALRRHDAAAVLVLPGSAADTARTGAA